MSQSSKSSDQTTASVTNLAQDKIPKTYPCPRCATQTSWQDNPSKPFCSPRCKLIDLGAWANGDYKVAAEDSPFSSDMSQDFPD